MSTKGIYKIIDGDLKQYFAFLTIEYGYELVYWDARGLNCYHVYRNSRLRLDVNISYELRECYCSIDIIKTPRSGAFLPPQNESYGMCFNTFLRQVAPDEDIRPLISTKPLPEDYQKRYGGEDGIKLYLQDCSARLNTYGSELLKGDFSECRLDYMFSESWKNVLLRSLKTMWKKP